MKPRVLILGHTLAGLVTAWRLSSAQYHVTILRIGNTPHTLTSLPHEEETFEYNSPDSSVLYGSRTYTQSLLRDLHLSLNWKRVPIEFIRLPSTLARLTIPNLPAPWNILWGFSTFSGLPLGQRWQALNYVEKVWEGVTDLPNVLDLQTAESWLTSLGQTRQTQIGIWEPLCQFLIGTPLGNTRAGKFAMMLLRVFFQSRHHNPHITQWPHFSTWLEKSLFEQLQQQGAIIDDIPAIEYLQIGTEQVTGVFTSHGTLYTADSYVAAVNPTTISSFLPERWLARFSSFHHMNQTGFTPRVTFQVFSHHPINTPQLILHDGRFAWTVCHPLSSPKKPASLVTCISTGDAEFLSASDEYIQACAYETVHKIFPNQAPSTWERLPNAHITRQPAGFIPHIPGSEPTRPSNQTPIKNFLLAGSWTDTGASTEVESAIASGEMCAQAIIEQHGQKD